MYNTIDITYYFWDGTKVVIVDHFLQPRERAARFHNMPCMVVECSMEPYFRKYNWLGWKILTPNRIPKPLRALALLIT